VQNGGTLGMGHDGVFGALRQPCKGRWALETGKRMQALPALGDEITLSS
jgi:hypothetical protein